MMTTELGDFPRRAQTVPRLDLRPLAQLAPALGTPRPAPGPRTTPVAAQDLDALQFYALLRIPVVKLDIKRVIAADARDLALVPFSPRFKIGLDPVALARRLRALRAAAPAPRARAAPRTRPLLDVALFDVALLLAVVVCVGKLREK